MAREVELKRVELKVSVHCCEGCKRKVKKVLQSIEGVLKTEIDPTQPKVTVVLGNIDPQILVKKLMRAGKQVEIWPCNSKKENLNNPAAAGKGKEYGEAAGSFINGKQKGTDDGIGDGCHGGGGGKKSVSEWDQDHQGGGCTVNKQRKESSTSGGSANTYTYTNTKTKTKGEGCCKQGVIETKNSNSNHGGNGPPPPPPPTPTATLYPSLVQNANGNGNITSSATSANNGSTRTHCCMVEPRAIPPPVAPYYTMTLMGSHSNSSNYALPHQFNYAPPDHFLHLPPPPVPVSMPMVGDYFSDENTVGCHVM